MHIDAWDWMRCHSQQYFYRPWLFHLRVRQWSRVFNSVSFERSTSSRSTSGDQVLECNTNQSNRANYNNHRGDTFWDDSCSYVGDNFRHSPCSRTIVHGVFWAFHGYCQQRIYGLRQQYLKQKCYVGFPSWMFN